MIARAARARYAQRSAFPRSFTIGESMVNRPIVLFLISISPARLIFYCKTKFFAPVSARTGIKDLQVIFVQPDRHGGGQAFLLAGWLGLLGLSGVAFIAPPYLPVGRPACFAV